jgi:hypothetical protein
MDFAGSLAMFHGNNERVSVGSVGMTTDLLARTVERFGDRVRGGR